MSKRKIDFNKINIITVAKVASANFYHCNYKNVTSLKQIHHSHSLLYLKNVLKKSKNGLIIVGVRNPIDRNLSYLFQTKDNYFFNDVKTKNNNYRGENCYIPGIKYNTSPKEIIKLYFKQNYHNTFNEWFREFLEITKINSFNKKKGLDFYNFPNNNTIMIYTMEKLDKNKDEICNLLGITNFKNINAKTKSGIKIELTPDLDIPLNDILTQKGKELLDNIQYKDVKNEIVYKKKYLDNLLNTEIIRLFYNNSDIEKFYLKYKTFDKKIPDNVVFNDGKFDANTKNYPTTTSSPSFSPLNVDRSDSIKADKYFSSKLNELKSEYKSLVDEYKWTNIIYNASYNFQPILGKLYYLYLNKNEEYFLSIIEPSEWNQTYVGTFKLLNSGKWEKVIA